jgi:FeS assembly SUF system protein
MNKSELEAKVVDVLKTVYDPEIPVNIHDLGLIYEVKIDDDLNVKVVMTLTAPNCPVADSMPNEVKQKVSNMEEVRSADVELTFDPPWSKDMMSDAAMLDLGFL